MARQAFWLHLCRRTKVERVNTGMVEPRKSSPAEPEVLSYIGNVYPLHHPVASRYLLSTSFQLTTFQKASTKSARRFW